MTPWNWRKVQRAAVGAITLSLAAIVEAQTPAPLPAETSDVAVLEPAGPHRAFIMGGYRIEGANVIDGDDERLKILGMIPVNRGGVMTIASDASRIAVVETFYSRGNRGTREDVLALYDGQTLDLVKEIVLPGRGLIVPKRNLLELSADNRLAYVYDFSPASSVHVVDLEEGKVVTSVDLPGCALAIPYGNRSFGSICGDGTVGSTQISETGTPATVFSKPFFDADLDPLFENSVIDKTTGESWMISYTGKIYPVKFGNGAPVAGKPWSVSAAAGFPVAGTGVQELAWRPGGSGQLLALHRDRKHLYVLMHTGNHWTHKVPGKEVWILDAVKQTLIKRVTLEKEAHGIVVTQDANPLLFVLSEGEVAVLDGTTGAKLRKRRLPNSLAWVPGS